MITGYEIRFARLDEQGAVRRFIDSHWRKDHVLARSGELFDWQYRSEADQRYNIILGVNEETSEIDGMLGFIPLWHFDRSLLDQREIWLAVWKVRDDVSATGLGLAMVLNLRNSTGAHSIGVVGLSDDAKTIYRALGYQCGTLDHYYFVNPNRTAFDLLGNFDGRYFETTSAVNPAKRLVLLEQSQYESALRSALADSQTRPRKSPQYFIQRYAEHPFYRYQMWAIEGDDGTEAVMVTREASAAGSVAIRIVDACGKAGAWSGIQDALSDTLESLGAEYADLYATGDVIGEAASAGFLKRDSNSSVIVPNYFEPFEQKNVDLDFACWSDDKAPYQFYKGDSDQDRPNLRDG